MTTPRVQKNKTAESPGMEDSACLDLSIKQVWLIVHFADSDPGNEFEIVSDKQLVGDSWETLEKGVEVVVAYGNAKVQGTVLTVSDDLQYLTKNFVSLTEEFLERNKKQPRNPARFTVKQDVIKVMDRSAQTDPVEIDVKVNKHYLELMHKYEIVKQGLKRIKQALKEVKNGVSSTISAIDEIDEDSDKPEVLKPLNINDNKIQSTQHNSSGENDADMIYIGPGRTKISASSYDSINWASYSAATRKLLVLLFSRYVLASHSLTGKPSPAFGDKEAKMRLNPTIVADIVDVVSKKCKVTESLVRSAITTKCADENKMYKRRVEKKKKISGKHAC